MVYGVLLSKLGLIYETESMKYSKFTVLKFCFFVFFITSAVYPYSMSKKKEGGNQDSIPNLSKTGGGGGREL